MQEPSGRMTLPEEALDRVEDLSLEEQFHSLKTKAKELERETGKAHPVFRVGEEVELKGGKFRVANITRKGIRLLAIPY
jgi:hypothetical protein